jgi:hypothetical protein
MQRGAADLRAEVVPLTSMWPSEHAQFNSLARLTAFAFKEYPLRPMRDALERSPFLACPCIGAADSAVKGETVTTSSKCMPLHPFNYSSRVLERFHLKAFILVGQGCRSIDSILINSTGRTQSNSL